MARLFARLLTLSIVLIPLPVLAQGVLVVVDPEQMVRLPRPIVIWPPERPIVRPVPPASYKIKELDVQARLVDQVAQVQVSQTFTNTGSRPLEVSFIFPLPYDGAIEQMTLLVDGKEFPAKLLKAEDARRFYEDIVRKNRDPALLEWLGTGLFKTSVFPVPAGQSRTVSLRYSQFCRKHEGLTDFLFPLGTAKYTADAVEKIGIRVTIESQDEIKNVYSPTHNVKIERPDPRHATVTYKAEREVPTADYRLFYDVGQGTVSTRVLSYRPEKGSEDGYFLLLATPEIKARGDKSQAKTVVFAVDRSGSMTGKKIEQTRGAAKFILENLRPGDLFNIIAYDSQVESFRPELQKYDDATRKAALGFIEGLYAGGSTNINGALEAALGQLQDSSQPSYVLFLTDGLPTTGVTNEAEILKNARQANHVRARVFAFGAGYDVNSKLLDKLVRENYGQSEYVRPSEDIEDRVSRLYRRIESPVMTDVELEFAFDEVHAEEGKPINRVYPEDSFDLFAGEQLVVVGRYKKFGRAKVVVSGSVGGARQTFDFPADFVEKSRDDTNAFIEKLWAVRRVGEILDELDLKGKNEELIKELVELSTKHGILTPYTSFLADDGTSVRDLARNASRAEGRLDALAESAGESGVVQRAYKGAMQRAAQVPAAPAAEMMPGMIADSARPTKPSAGRALPGQAQGHAGLGYGADADKELEQATRNVRTIANRAFYRRGDQWVDSTVTKEQEKNVVRIKQFTDKYFDLARRHGRQFSQYMVFDEPVLVNVENQAYLIEP
jgi:Ca-activated chloride channel family protein